MNIMNFDKALSILGLTKNYTEEELKQAYRRLITKYHPDKYADKSEAEKKMAEEKAKEINAAKDFLEKNKGQRTQTFTNNNNNNHYGSAAYNYLVFLEAKSSFIKELTNNNIELREIMFKSIPVILQKTIETLLRKNKQYLDTIIIVRNIEELNKKIITYKGEVWKELELFTIEYCKKYNINTDTSKLEKYSLKKLYEELEEIRKMQNKNNNILDIIEEEYTLYAGYNVIKENIFEIKKQLLKEYKEGLYTEEEVKNKFKTKVLLELQEYHRRLQIINYFKSLGYKDKTIKATIALMEENITSDKVIFSMYERKATNLIAEKETQRTSEVATKPLNRKDEIEYNHSDKIIKKDSFINEKYFNNKKLIKKIY